MQDYPRNVRDTFSIIPESDEITRDVFHTNLAAMLITSFRSGRIIDANDVFFATFGLNRSYTIGKTALELNLISDADRIEAMRILEGGGVIRGVERKYRRPDNSHLYVSWTAELVTIKNKECLFSVFLDITQLKITQQELKESKKKIERANSELERAMEIRNQFAQEAEEASKAKSAFLANTSHEIRTPMNAIVGYTEMLLDDDVTAEQRHALKMIEYSAENLLALLDNILDLSKIEANKLIFEKVSFNIEKLVFQTMHLVHIKAANDNVEMLADTSGITTDVIGDPMRLRQVLTNLLSNATKFTSDGQIFVRAREAGYEGTKVNIEFTIQDTGIGIEDDMIQKIFEPFVQADDSITRQYGGTGLGLAICKNLVSLMNGNIRVKSKRHEGSAFTFDVWLERRVSSSNPGDQGTEPPVSLAGKTTLIAEDNLTSMRILENMLVESNIQIVKAHSTAEAIDCLQREHVDIALIDTLLQSSDTAGLPDTLREASRNPNIQLVGLSHLCNPTRQQKNGYNGYITKPIDRTRLLAMMQKMLGFTRHPKLPFSANSISAVPFISARILVAEDHEVNQQLMTSMITRMGHSVHIAADGIQALQMARSEVYDLILMDMQMPGLSGLEVTRKIRETGNNVPIVALTASAMKGDMEQCLRNGMNDYISKPIKRDILQKVLYKHLGIGAKDEARSKIRALMISRDDETCRVVKLNLQRMLPTASFRQVPSEVEGMVTIGSLLPHIIIIDLATVQVDTVSLLSYLQKDEHYASVSVIAIVEPAQNLTAVNQLFMFPNVEILSKPIDKTDLLDALGQLVSGSVPLVSYIPGPNTEHSELPPSTQHSVPLDLVRGQSGPTLSLEKIAKEMMLDMKEYQYLLDQYILSNSQILEKMELDFSHQDTIELARKTHAIRGSSGNLFLKEMASQCAELETAVHQGDWRRAADEFEKVKAIFNMISSLRNHP